MSIEVFPEWLVNLAQEDIAFIKTFILASGSLKEMAQQYDVSYPTVRLRLDKLITKIKETDDLAFDPYVALVKSLAMDGQIEKDATKKLIDEYRKVADK